MRIRPERVAQLLRREIADILEHRMRDPRLGRWISITDVEVTRDLSVARVFFSVMAEGAEREEAAGLLNKAAPYIRRQLAPRLGMREVPEVRFKMDESLEHGARVNDLLHRIERGETFEDENLD